MMITIMMIIATHILKVGQTSAARTVQEGIPSQNPTIPAAGPELYLTREAAFDNWVTRRGKSSNTRRNLGINEACLLEHTRLQGVKCVQEAEWTCL